MRRLDNANSGLFLFFQYLLMQLMHLGPMHLWLVVVLCMVAVVEPDQIVKLVVTAHTPSHRLRPDFPPKAPVAVYKCKGMRPGKKTAIETQKTSTSKKNTK